VHDLIRGIRVQYIFLLSVVGALEDQMDDLAELVAMRDVGALTYLLGRMVRQVADSKAGDAGGAPGAGCASADAEALGKVCEALSGLIGRTVDGVSIDAATAFIQASGLNVVADLLQLHDVLAPETLDAALLLCLWTRCRRSMWEPMGTKRPHQWVRVAKALLSATEAGVWSFSTSGDAQTAASTQAAASTQTAASAAQAAASAAQAAASAAQAAASAAQAAAADCAQSARLGRLEALAPRGIAGLFADLAYYCQAVVADGAVCEWAAAQVQMYGAGSAGVVELLVNLVQDSSATSKRNAQTLEDAGAFARVLEDVVGGKVAPAETADVVQALVNAVIACADGASAENHMCARWLKSGFAGRVWDFCNGAVCDETHVAGPVCQELCTLLGQGLRDTAQAAVSAVQAEGHQALASAQQALAQTQQALASTQQDLASTQQDLASTQQDLASTQQDLASTQQDLASTQQDLAQAKQTLAQTQQDLAQARRVAVDQQQVLGEVYEERYAAVRDAAQARQKVAQAAADAAQYRAEYRAALSRAKHELQDAQIQVTQHREKAWLKLADARDETTRARHETASVLGELTATRNEVAYLRRALVKALDDREQAWEDLAEAEAAIAYETRRALDAQSDAMKCL